MFPAGALNLDKCWTIYPYCKTAVHSPALSYVRHNCTTLYRTALHCSVLSCRGFLVKPGTLPWTVHHIPVSLTCIVLLSVLLYASVNIHFTAMGMVNAARERTVQLQCEVLYVQVHWQTYSSVRGTYILSSRSFFVQLKCEVLSLPEALADVQYTYVAR